MIIKKGACMLIDVAIPGDRNVFKREAKKILKYRVIEKDGRDLKLL